MGNYEYFRKIDTNRNLLIFCQTTSNTSGAKTSWYHWRHLKISSDGAGTSMVQKWRHTRGTEFAVKSQFSR